MTRTVLGHGTFLLAMLIVIATALLFSSNAGLAEVPPCTAEWVGRTPDLEAVRSGKLKSLCGAHLPYMDLTAADLREANLTSANLAKAILSDANLAGAHLERATISDEATLYRTNLAGAYLRDANLSGAFLRRANLAGADLRGAILTGADLIDANLAGADLLAVNLKSVTFEPKLESISSVVNIEFAHNLSGLTFFESPAALVHLRERFAKSGLRDLEREITYAKLRTQRLRAWTKGTFTDRLGGAFSYGAFELTCGYGLWYGRPLKLLAGTIPLFALIYAFGLRSNRRGALWRVWASDRVRKDEGQLEPERLSWEKPQLPGAPRRRSFVRRLCRALGLGLLFSLVSAFHIGWRELNVGNWIARLQPREYTLRATGWLRVVSGVQSLLSVYLLALWVLTYFGRPFE